MLSNLTYAPRDSGCGLSYGDFKAIGQLCFTQLAELRHRGAFSTVSQTFVTCCHQCEQSGDPSILMLPGRWLNVSSIIPVSSMIIGNYMQDALQIIDEQSSKLTRRSAGIPAMVTGIISANPGGLLFQKAMKSLTDIAQTPPSVLENQDEIKLPQVHALNCLKDIVTNTKLGSSTEVFIKLLVQISVRSIESGRYVLFIPCHWLLKYFTGGPFETAGSCCCEH
jgi:hypothetical protein